MSSNEHITVIDANSKWWKGVYLKEIFKYKDLIKLFVKKEFSLIYKQTILGPLWIILNPLLSSVVFSIVFGNLAGLSTDGVPEMLFYMAGNTMWGLFSSCVITTGNVFVTNSNMFGKVYFPRLVMPISQAITSIIHFLIQFAMLCILLIYFSITQGTIYLFSQILILPVLIIQCALLSFGVGIIISSLTTKYRDLAIAVTFGVQLWMYLTPVVYSYTEMPKNIQNLLLINPMTAIVHNFKWAVLNTGECITTGWIISVVMTLIIAVIGVVLFSRVEKNFIDTV